jgi:hypothetical protein
MLAVVAEDEMRLLASYEAGNVCSRVKNQTICGHRDVCDRTRMFVYKVIPEIRDPDPRCKDTIMNGAKPLFPHMPL